MEGLVGRFIIFGDWGELCNSHQKKINRNMHNVANIDLIVSVGDNFYNVDPDDEEMDIDTDFSFEKKSLRSLYDVLNKPGIRKKEKKRLIFKTKKKQTSWHWPVFHLPLNTSQESNHRIQTS